MCVWMQLFANCLFAESLLKYSYTYKLKSQKKKLIANKLNIQTKTDSRVILRMLFHIWVLERFHMLPHPPVFSFECTHTLNEVFSFPMHTCKRIFTSRGALSPLNCVKFGYTLISLSIFYISRFSIYRHLHWSWQITFIDRHLGPNWIEQSWPSTRPPSPSIQIGHQVLSRILFH